jgi:hypothetical protein
MAGAAYCDTFTSRASGWPSTNTADFYYGYNDYGGGTYRIGSRTASSIDSVAPVSVADLSSDYSIQLDADVAFNPESPAGSGFGLTCWNHASKGGEESAFVFFVYRDQSDIVLWPEGGRRPVTLAARSASLLRTGSAMNHLTATCAQQLGPDGKVQASLRLSVNGTPAVSAVYGKGAGHAAWSVSDAHGLSRIGVLATGAGADAFFDDVAVRAI